MKRMYGTYVEIDVVDSEGFDGGFKAFGDAAVVFVPTGRQGSVCELLTFQDASVLRPLGTRQEAGTRSP